MAMNSYDAYYHKMPNLIPGICRKFIPSQFSKLDLKMVQIFWEVYIGASFAKSKMRLQGNKVKLAEKLDYPSFGQ